MSDIASPAASTSSFKFPRPDPYLGVRDGFQCLAWLTSLRRFFVGAKILDDQRTLHAVIFLSGSAALWWEGSGLQDTAPFSKFESAFKAEYCPAGFEDHVRSLLFSIRLETTVADYIARLRRYMAILCPPMMSDEARTVLEQTAKTCFLNGAPENLRQMLQSLDIASGSTKTIHDLCSAAEQFDSIYHFSVATPQSSTQRSQSFASAHSAAQPDPMAMEIDNLRIQLNVLRRQFNNLGSFRPRSSNQSLSRLDDAERSRLYQRGACFRCRQDGHQARDCPNRSRSFNSMSYGSSSSSLSGKAHSD